MKSVSGVWIILLTALAAATSFYLFYHHLYGAGDFCSAIFSRSCDGALNSNFGTFGALPLGGWGLLYYFTILLLLLAPGLFGAEFTKAANGLVFLFSFIAVLAGVFFIILMIVRPNLFCPFCTIVHLSNFLLFFLLARFNRYGLKDFSAWLQSLTLKNTFSQSTSWKWLGFGILLFFTASLFMGLRTWTNKAARAIDLPKIFADYDKSPKKKLRLNDGDAFIGDSSMPLKLVIFSDFYCPGCRMFSAEVDSTIKNFGNVCQVVFKQFPLSNACNPRLQQNLHPAACETAKASLAAHRQGKFLQFHHELFAASPRINLVAIAEECDLDMAGFDSFRNSNEANLILQENIREAEELGISETPSVFLNGKKVPDIRPGVLSLLMMRELTKRVKMRVIE